jgi:hypothetical protein
VSETAELFDDGGGTPTPPPATPAATLDTAKVTPAAADGGDGYEFPWLKEAVGGKYKTTSDFVQGYSESSKQAREFKKAADEASERLKALEGIVGAPKGEDGKPAPYQFALPEGVELMPELMDAFQGDLREMDLSPAVGQRILNRYMEVEAGVEHGRREVEKGFVVKELGAGDESVAVAAVNESLAWARQMLGDAPEVEDLLTSPGGVSSYGKSLVALARLRSAVMGGTMGASSGTGAFGEAEYQAALAKQVTGRLSSEEESRMVAYLNARHPDKRE